MPKVTVIDYGVGNILNLIRALEYCGAEATLTDSSEMITNAERLVLSGVGSFPKGMLELRQRGLINPIVKYAVSGRPFLGICLGMQMMFDCSEEFGLHEGLGLIAGKVTAIPSKGKNDQPVKIPHMGWNEIEQSSSGTKWENTILAGLTSGTSFYFVHSYTAIPLNPEHRLAECDYNGIPISAVVRSDSKYGCQFHPERSGEFGLTIIKNFIGMSLGQ